MNLAKVLRIKIESLFQIWAKDSSLFRVYFEESLLTDTSI